jgi:hypothetical protein
MAAVVAFLAGTMRSECQVRTLPVYFVTQTGALPPQAAALATALGIPTNRISMTNGQVSFIDSSNFLGVPTLPVTNGVAVSNLLAQTTNKYPAIPIRFEQLDFATLAGFVPFSSNAAVNLSSAALNNAGLMPASASPVVVHDILVATYTNDNLTVMSVSNALDTEVDYQFTVPAGYPLVGPGAQIQFNFNAGGNATRMLYAARQLAPGPTVSIITSATASNRAAAFYPGLSPQLNVQLVYYAPPLTITSVLAVIPWYQCTGSGTVSNTFTGAVTPVELNPMFIPATDDTNYVPLVTLNAFLSAGGMQVNGSATVAGGRPPYTFSWGGSGASTAGAGGQEIVYQPSARVPPSTLVPVQTASPSALGLAWFDPAQYFVLQSSSNLVTGSWSAVTNPVSANNGQMSVTVGTGQATTRFFRLSASGPVVPQPETLTLSVHDGNGVGVTAQQSFPVALATVQPPNTVLHFGPTWGVESPYDPGLGTGDRLDWTAGMSNPIFGTQALYDFDYAAVPYDFKCCLDGRHIINQSEEPNGDYDSTVGTADILLYIGHGNANLFTFTSPWSVVDYLYYPNAFYAWGNLVQVCGDGSPIASQEWLGLLSCEVLTYTNQSGVFAADRWLQDFNGLHLLLGFATDAYAGTGFPKVFARNMGGGGPPESICKAWFDAAKSCGTGSPAVLAPLGPSLVWDLGDYWWGQGAVGPTILASQIHGWYYLVQQ